MSKNKKNKFKYNLILLNESTLEEVFRIKTSKLTFSLALGIFTILSFTLLSIIIFITPLKHMLPGYADVSVREDVLIEAQRIDSLETIAQNNELGQEIKHFHLHLKPQYQEKVVFLP